MWQRGVVAEAVRVDGQRMQYTPLVCFVVGGSRNFRGAIHLHVPVFLVCQAHCCRVCVYMCVCVIPQAGELRGCGGDDRRALVRRLAPVVLAHLFDWYHVLLATVGADMFVYCICSVSVGVLCGELLCTRDATPCGYRGLLVVAGCEECLGRGGRHVLLLYM